MCECGNSMALHRYAVLIDFIVKGLAEDDGVSSAILGPVSLGTVRGKPEVNAIKLCGVRDYVTSSPYVSERNRLRVRRTLSAPV